MSRKNEIRSRLDVLMDCIGDALFELRDEKDVDIYDIYSYVREAKELLIERGD